MNLREQGNEAYRQFMARGDGLSAHFNQEQTFSVAFGYGVQAGMQNALKLMAEHARAKGIPGIDELLKEQGL